ncbi:polysaccharide lyase family 8 super-sandwich domain-containing protein [Bacteroides zoogleoformans]|uniref:polysaccharide lyase family 8 super-sandwich domain-containing protein n=1 Tax=Bacteroides zoogleoformans TaxID=28119 RepID=UPI00248E11CA|nr:polysaccharide lyase family 8 super-sandwich domain-containing protein [Bacteroides zoogleoformans]
MKRAFICPMNRITVTVIAVFFLFLPAAHAQEITFAEKEHDLGWIDESEGDACYDFRFINTGSEPLVIKQVITGCGCTSAKWKDKPYRPGEKGVIRITYHPEGRKAELFSIPTEVFANRKGGPVTLTLTGKVRLAHHPYINHFDPDKGKKAAYKPTQPKDDYELVLQRVRQRLYESTPVETLNKNATSLMKLMTPDGKWPQIDYKCFFRTNWEPQEHLNRVRRMLTAYTCPESDLYGNQVLYRAINRALLTWDEYKPTSYNWWYNDISVPKMMADILALHEAAPVKVSPAIIQGLMEMMAKSDPRKWTGANKQDIAMHHMIRGCVLKNDSIVRTNVGEFFQPVCITRFEGIREDLSYQQHGNQLYIGGYGTVFVNNIALVAPLFAGTRYAMSETQTRLFSEFVRGTYLNVFRSRYMDFSVCGRSVSRKNILDFGDYADLFKKMKQLDPAHAEEYDAAARRFAAKEASYGRNNRNKLYELSDYMLHNRKRYDFSVRAVSTRTCRSESGNGENLLGTYLSEGATNIRITGDEYLNIFGVWEWDKIPGTTAPTGETENRNEWGVKGVADFVGGVSDGMYGVMAYAMNDYDTRANKGWFMFDNEIVCLGSGITGGAGHEVNTSVNQCHLVGDVYALANGQLSKIAAGSPVNTSYQGWIWHNKVGYYFPDSTTVHLKHGNQSGKWSRINFNQSGETETLPVFNLWMSHGSNPQQGRYAYILLPGIASPASLKAYDTNAVRIESHTAELQAVTHVKSGITQAIFFAPGKLNCGDYMIEAEKPCVIMMKRNGTDAPDIQVSDPTRKTVFEVGREVKLKAIGTDLVE